MSEQFSDHMPESSYEVVRRLYAAGDSLAGICEDNRVSESEALAVLRNQVEPIDDLFQPAIEVRLIDEGYHLNETETTYDVIMRTIQNYRDTVGENSDPIESISIHPATIAEIEDQIDDPEHWVTPYGVFRFVEDSAMPAGLVHVSN